MIWAYSERGLGSQFIRGKILQKLCTPVSEGKGKPHVAGKTQAEGGAHRATEPTSVPTRDHIEFLYAVETSVVA